MSRLLARIGTLRPLEVLIKVYERGSVTDAARELHLTQPTVSMQMKKLSEAVGEPLYQQSGRQIYFTEAGLATLRMAREVLSNVESLEGRLAALNGLKAGTLRIGVVTTAKYFIPHLIGDFVKRYPDIEVDFKVGNREQIIEMLEAGREDFYVFSHPPQRELILREFVPNPLVAIAEKSHPLAEQTSITLAEFAKYPFLMRESGSGTRHAILRHMDKQCIQLNVRMTIESNEAIKHAVMSGLGVSILSSHTLTYGGSTGLIRLNVETLPIKTRWFLAQPQARALSAVGNAFLEHIETVGRDQLLEQLANLD